MTQQEIAELRVMSEEKTVKEQFVADDDERGKPHFLDPLVTLAKRWVLVAAFPIVVGALAALISLILPATYTAETKVVPPQNTSSSSSILSQLGPLASAAHGKGSEPARPRRFVCGHAAQPDHS